MCCISLEDITNDYQIIDIRDSYSFHRSHLRNSINAPSTSLNNQLLNKPTVLICYSGKQAKELAKYYNSLGLNCYYLKDGYKSIVNINLNYY
ncbi:MAG: rhodanese-like domain-containing protein [Erysipelotrichaceae bacterium]|nr:rhodanese-like domain-containing protein [Erysipelotrichaceae bacterium]